MASSRNMRRSRRTSPMDTSTPDGISRKNEVQSDNYHEDSSEGWSEPPLRVPVPSFEDYKGLERHGVLEHMAPLGSLPSSKVRARLKQHEPPRRTVHLKNGDLKVAREEVNTPDPAPPVAARWSEPRNTEERVAKLSSSRERDEDHDYTPTLKSNTRTAPAKAAPLHAAHHGTTTSRSAQGRLKLKQIVDSAVRRSNELGDVVLGIAVKELYEESLRDPEVADLLDGVLTQKPTPEQTAEFQSRIRATRRKHRDHKTHQDSTSKVLSTSPAAKSARSSVTRHLDTSKYPSPVLNNYPPNSNHRSSKQNPTNMPANESPLKEERPSKRIKRSISASSDSSLSSLDSAIEDFPPMIDTSMNNTTNHLSHHRLYPSKAQPPNGPRLGTFPIRPTDPSTRRPILLSASSNPPPEDMAAKKREELRQKFANFVGVQDSAIRASPSPMYLPQSTPAIAAFTERKQQGRLRNGAGQQKAKDPYDPLDSPASSSFGDLLVPPPPGASRGATPNQLGRPSKALKKAARIKMSPTKKRTTTTAGRGAEGESGITSNGRPDNSQNDGNSDVCTACSGDGSLLCCDGCSRAFHLTCCDPPVGESPEGTWFCNRCSEDRRTTQRTQPRGLFQGLLSDLNRRNPMSYTLPQQLRNHFDGVKTGEDGEYEEVTVVKANKTRGGYEELPNNFKLKDGKDHTVLCFRCSKSSMGHREIISCDYCNLSWHLDCLDPPLALAPKKGINGRAKSAWMCPNHIDSELNNIGPNVNATNKVMPTTGRKYKIRRPKIMSIVDIALRRGFRNNGLIEIENESSDEDKFTKKISGLIYRVPETGIKLDFIDRVKRANAEEAQARAVKQARLSNTRTSPSYQQPFDRRQFKERKAALNLIQLAQTSDSSISSDTVQNLIGTLIAEAPIDVENLITAGSAPNEEVTTEERKDLEAIIDLARRRLACGKKN